MPKRKIMNGLGEHFYNPITKELIDVNVTGGGDHAIAAGILTVKDFKEKFMPIIDKHINQANPRELQKIDDLKKVGWIFPETVSFIEKFEPNIRKWPLYDFYSKNSTLQSNKFDKIADAVKKLGFILTRNQNVEIANWGPDKKKQLADCINKIKDDPKYMNNEKEFDDMDINIFDYSTKRNWTEKVKDILYDSFSIKSDTNSDAKEIRGRYYQSPFANTRGDLRAFQRQFTSDSYNPSLNISFKTFMENENTNKDAKTAKEILGSVKLHDHKYKIYKVAKGNDKTLLKLKYKEAEKDGLLEDVLKNGIKHPIEIKVDKNGNHTLMKGHHRLAIALKHFPKRLIKIKYIKS